MSSKKRKHFGLRKIKAEKIRYSFVKGLETDVTYFSGISEWMKCKPGEITRFLFAIIFYSALLVLNKRGSFTWPFDKYLYQQYSQN